LAPPSSYDWEDVEYMVEYFAGPIIGKNDKQNLLDNGNLCQGEAVFIPTGFKPVSDPSVNYSHALSEMARDLNRNQLIAETVIKHKGNGVTLIVSERQEQCEAMGALFRDNHKIDAAVLTGNTPEKKRYQIINDLKSGKCDLLIVTNHLIGKAFELPEIGTLALATPLKNSGRLKQYVKLALKAGPRKDKYVILDFVDAHDVFESSAWSRWRKYKQQDLSIVGVFE
jgi:superfamily II DNA or RNA helicase